MVTSDRKVTVAAFSEADFPRYFGEWLKRRREELNLTQAELARRACCTVFTIRKIETGERRPSKQLAELLAKALDTPPENKATFIKVARGELSPERLAAPTDLPAVSSQAADKFSHERGNLPRALTPFVGRERELTEIGKLLRDPQCSLLTLIGPGGVGKTRLALQAGTDLNAVFPDGVYFVSLAAIERADLVPVVIANALQISQSAHTDPKARLLEFLANQEMLLILDNLEQLQGVSELIGMILTHTQKLTLLATSRERLHLAGEWVFSVEGLPTSKPGEPATGHSSSSSELFLQYAKRLQPDFSPDTAQQDAIEQICWLLDGLPLAIELAAAWVHLLPCAEIAREIQQDLDFLSEDRTGESARHTSMRVVLDHSWELLTPEEQAIFCKLSVFQGSFEREAAQVVAGARLTDLRLLVDKSLIRRNSLDRYDLHGLTRQYAHEQLANAGEEKEVRNQALGYYLSLAERVVPGIRDEGNLVWQRCLEEELENLRAALEWALASKQIEAGIRLTWALFRLWYWYNHHIQETRRWVDALLSSAEGVPDLPADLMGNLLYEAGTIATMQFDLTSAEAFLDRSLALYESIGDKHGQAAVLGSLGVLSSRQKKVAQGRSLLEACVALRRELGENVASQLNNLGMLAYYEEDYIQAKSYFEECIQDQREYYVPGLTSLYLCSLAGTEMNLGDRQAAMTHYLEGLRLVPNDNNREVVAYVLEGVAACHVSGGPGEDDPHFAARLLGAAAALRKAIGVPLGVFEARDSQRATVQARTSLGEAVFRAAWQEGETKPLETIIQEILQLNG